VVIIDTDVLLIEFRFQRDKKYPVNNQFLSIVKTAGGAITVCTLMEFLGNMSFNVDASKLVKWQSWLRDAYNLAIRLPEAPYSNANDIIHSLFYENPFQRICRSPIAFMDALILDLAEQVKDGEAFVTWNAKHFAGKTSLAVHTPEEYLASGASTISL
jgi:hypothetical protein